jgi:hypothetical protein
MKSLNADRVYILGAGFSKNISSEMPLMTELRNKTVPKLGLAKYYPGISENLENLLTFLAQEQPWLMPDRNLINQARFYQLTRAIVRVISQSQLKAMAKPIPEWLADLISIWRDQNATVITLNYDTLVEAAFGELAPNPNSGSEYELSYQSGLLHSGSRVRHSFLDRDVWGL